VLPSTGVSVNAPRVTVPRSTPSSTEIVQAPVSLLWQYIAIALGLMWLVSTWLWFSLRRQVTRLQSAETVRFVPQFEDPDEKRLFSDFMNACKHNQAPEAHRQLFLWAKAKYPELQSLTDLAQNKPGSALTTEIDQLEAALYGNGDKTAWHGRQLSKTVKELRQQKAGSKKRAALEPRLNPA
jgi:hypothetical protein